MDVSQPLVEVADLAALDVVLDLTPADAGRVRPGQRVAFWAGASASGDSLGAGAVSEVGAAVDSATRAVHVRVRVGRSGRPLKIGEAVFGRIAVGVDPHAVTVPLEALVPEGESSRCSWWTARASPTRATVTVGGRSESAAEITSGLTGGETVVTYGAYGVSGQREDRPGQAVKLFDVLVRQRRFVYLAVALLSAAGIYSAADPPVGDLSRAGLPAHRHRGRGLARSARGRWSSASPGPSRRR